MTRQLRLGTRGSLLALWQANRVKAELEAGDPASEVELVTIRTRGDRVVDRPLAAIGGKGLFSKELDEALLGKDISLAVHSLKDLPFTLPDGIRLAAVLRRGDARDAFVSDGRALSEMPGKSRIGTSSLRRRAQLLARHAELDVADLRGNVDTRLRKLDEGEYDGIVLASAGLDRLGHGDRISERLDTDVLLPAVGQGAVVAVCRQDDETTSDQLAALDHAETRLAILAERALLEVLEGNCQVPVGGYATVEGDSLVLRGLIASPDGTQLVRDQMMGPRSDPARLGHDLGHRLLDTGGQKILSDIQVHGA